jgi:predicted GNAT family N-acyltransferase
MNNRIVDPQQISFSIFSGVPRKARELIWDVFFMSRKRGIDLPTHFPWIEQEQTTNCLMLSDAKDGATIATLVLRKQTLPSEISYGMIGMVCVDPAWRGCGFSARLLSNTIEFASEQQIHALVLWTGRPGIYSSHGFLSDACDNFGRIEFDSLRLRKQIMCSQRRIVSNRGLPPFAQQLVLFKSDEAEIIVIEMEQGIALAEWKGPLTAVLDLIDATLPATWHLNTPSNSPIIEGLSKRGYFYTPLPASQRMVRYIDKAVNIPYISVLDRI